MWGEFVKYCRDLSKLIKMEQYYQHSAPELVELSTLVAPEPEPQLQPHPLAVERRLKPAKVGKAAMEDDNCTPLHRAPAKLKRAPARVLSLWPLRPRRARRHRPRNLRPGPFSPSFARAGGGSSRGRFF